MISMSLINNGKIVLQIALQIAFNAHPKINEKVTVCKFEDLPGEDKRCLHTAVMKELEANDMKLPSPKDVHFRVRQYYNNRRNSEITKENVETRRLARKRKKVNSMNYVRTTFFDA